MPEGRGLRAAILMNAQPERPMQSLFPWFTVAFALAAVGSLLTREYTLGGAFVGIAALFFIFWRETRPWADLPRWQRLAMIGLLLVSATLAIIGFAASFF